MIFTETLLRAGDNAGARILKCVKVVGGFRKRSARLGDLIVISIKNLRHRKKLEKKKLYNGLIIATKRKTRRLDGSFIVFKRNRVLTLNDQLKFLGTRVYGPICKEIRTPKNEIKFKQIISYSGATV